MDLFREKHLSTNLACLLAFEWRVAGQSVGHVRRQEWPQNTMWFVFMGWVIWQAEWEDFSNKIFWGRGEDFQELSYCPLISL